MDLPDLEPEDEKALQFYNELTTPELLKAIYEIQLWLESGKLTEDMTDRSKLTLEILLEILSARNALIQ